MSDRRVSLLRTVNKTDLQVEKIAKRQHGLVAWRQLERLRITRHQIRRRVRTRQWGRELPGGWRVGVAGPRRVSKGFGGLPGGRSKALRAPRPYAHTCE